LHWLGDEKLHEAHGEYGIVGTELLLATPGCKGFKYFMCVSSD